AFATICFFLVGLCDIGLRMLACICLATLSRELQRSVLCEIASEALQMLLMGLLLNAAWRIVR
ncbi:hypothetical protein WJX84_004239, partial [Apatococcus fuscideae]